MKWPVLRFSGGVVIVLLGIEDDRYFKIVVVALQKDTSKWWAKAQAFHHPEDHYQVLVGASEEQMRKPLWGENPKVHDSVAHAALSFALDDQEDVAEKAATTDSGWHIGRKPEDAWPKGEQR